VFRRIGRWFRQTSDTWIRVLAPLLTIVLVVVAWDLWVRLDHVKAYISPSPGQVAQAMWDQRGVLLHDLWITCQEILMGFAMGIAVAIPLAIVIISFAAVEYAVYPLLVASQVVPKLAIAPLLIIWFGFGWTPKVLMVFSICFFPIVIDSTLGLRSISVEKLYLASSMGAGKLTTFMRFRIPEALPSIFTGLKIASTLAVIGAIVAEFAGSSDGIGHRMLLAQGTFDTKTMFAAITYITILGILIFLFMDVLERLVLPWHTSRRANAAATA
jgi:NitT/TauT family transport system permease protein